MLRGTRWEDTSRLAGTRIGCGAPGAATLQGPQPRCTVCSGSRTRLSRAHRPRSGLSLAGGAPGGRPARSSRVEYSHLRRHGEAILWAISSLHPGPGPPRLSSASGPCSDPGLRPKPRREGDSRGEHWRGKHGRWEERGLGVLITGRMCRREERVPSGSALRSPGLSTVGTQYRAEARRSDPTFKELRGKRNTILTLGY